MKSLVRFLAVAAAGLFATAAWAQFSNTPPQSGACFYVDYNFRGDSFCMNAGQDAGTVPSGFNDRIRSIRVFGRAQVIYFNDAMFRGNNGSTTRDISDLRQLPLPNVPEKNWATRISSIRVVGGGWPGGPGDRGRDSSRDRDDRYRDRDDRTWHSNDPTRTVTCNSDFRRDREWCRTPARVNSVRLVDDDNSRTPCLWNRTFGLDNGRLWTGRGCSGTFEIR